MRSEFLFVGVARSAILPRSKCVVFMIVNEHNHEENRGPGQSHVDDPMMLPAHKPGVYREFLQSRIFHGVVSDLDGVVLQDGQVHCAAFQSLLDATLCNPDGIVPLIIATGRSYSMIESRVLPYVNQVLKDVGKTLSPGDLLVFASNGAFACDVNTGDVLFDDRLCADDLSQLVQLESVKTLLLLRTIQQRCFGPDAALFDRTPHYALDDCAHTLLVGVITEEMDVVQNHSPRAATLCDTFQRLFGTAPGMNNIVAAVNQELAQSGLQIEAWTSNKARFIGFQKEGVSKQRAIDYIEARLASDGIPPSSALSIGDSPASNDGPLVFRDGGLCNRTSEEFSAQDLLIVDEPGDQWERVACLMKNATITPLDSRTDNNLYQ